MANKKEDAMDEPDAEATEGEGMPKKGKRKLLIMAAGGVLVLVIAGVAALLLGGGKEAPQPPEATETTPMAMAPVYYELPEFLVNLSGSGSRVSFLKMSVTLELRDKMAVATVDANKPRIVDTFNTYLRELRPADVQGSAGIYRLRDELMTRLNATVEEGIVKDILFSEIIVQ